MTAGITVVIPTLGRPSLTTLLETLAPALPGTPVELLIVDDRPDVRDELVVPPGVAAKILSGRAAGPAAARNLGWYAARHEWIAFLDDDIVPAADWLPRLLADVAAAPENVGGVQGSLRVHLPPDRRPTDWERMTAALADGDWITADMAYRREALTCVGGFDERLPRAFREDAELAHRVQRAGYVLRRGTRTVTHPVRPESRWVSLRTQRGNADDALLRHLYGRRWRTTLGIPPGRRARHAATTLAGLLGVAATAMGHRRTAIVFRTAWLAGVAEFAAARIKAGPPDPDEITTMVVTSVLIPPVAVAHWVWGWVRWYGARPLGTPLGTQR